MPHRTQGVDVVAIDSRCAARSGRISNLVRAVVLVRPKLFSCGCIQALNSLATRNRTRLADVVFNRQPLVFVLGPVHHKEAAVGDAGAGISRSDRHPPADLGATLWKLFEDAGFPPDPVHLFPHPARPVIG